MKKSPPLLIGLAQLNFTVGDIENNAKKIIQACHEAKKNHAELVIFPELALSGYPPEDLLFREDFLDRITASLKLIQKNLPEKLCAIIGYPEKIKSSSSRPRCYNSAIVLTQQKSIAHYRKQLLPNYGVFDEKRYFSPGNKTPCIFKFRRKTFALFICEDLWEPEPIQHLKSVCKKTGAIDYIISINASPFNHRKIETRLKQLKSQLKILSPLLTSGLIYVNHCTAQDDLIFDGSSVVLNPKGNLSRLGPFAEEAIVYFSDSNKSNNSNIKTPITLPLPEAQLYKALVLGVQEYVRKNHFQKVLLGFSGGIDSSLTLAIAVDALGKENVLPVFLPSRYTSTLSLVAAKQQLKLMGLNYRLISIEPFFQKAIKSLKLNISKPSKITAITLQNIQSRLRAVILMALSNEEHRLLLNTSNKSELAVGFGTLYGDMCGAYGVIKDLWKTEVYKISHYRNQLSPVIPEDILTRPPTAELADEQLDTDTLPPYDILDEILKQYIEQEKSIKAIIRAGFDKATVEKVVNLIVHNEHKRKQAPLGPRVSKLAFTRERRYPITSTYC